MLYIYNKPCLDAIKKEIQDQYFFLKGDYKSQFILPSHLAFVLQT